ncbi:MAG: hypothetical protein MZU91_07785 [Desulfosudis oleivorans]|nr:hypothetical protein [Desulfosudis oleivorans]
MTVEAAPTSLGLVAFDRDAGQRSALAVDDPAGDAPFGRHLREGQPGRRQTRDEDENEQSFFHRSFVPPLNLLSGLDLWRTAAVHRASCACAGVL